MKTGGPDRRKKEWWKSVAPRFTGKVDVCLMHVKSKCVEGMPCGGYVAGLGHFRERTMHCRIEVLERWINGKLWAIRIPACYTRGKPLAVAIQRLTGYKIISGDNLWKMFPRSHHLHHALFSEFHDSQFGAYNVIPIVPLFETYADYYYVLRDLFRLSDFRKRMAGNGQRKREQRRRQQWQEIRTNRLMLDRVRAALKSSNPREALLSLQREYGLTETSQH